MISPSKAIKDLPPYLFVHLVTLKKQARDLGRTIIDLGMGNPDMPTPKHIQDALRKAVRDPSTHRYPMASGSGVYAQAIAKFYNKRFGVKLNASEEILPLIGSKEGLGHTFFALANPGDTVIMPTPAYPAHTNIPYLSNTKAHWVALKEKDGFLMDFGSIPTKVLRKAKILLINYPNNPTGATAEKSYIKEAVKVAKKYGFLLIYDNAYSEMTFDGYKAPSALEIPGAKDVTMEFNSLSKTYSMAGWRVGYAAGNPKAIGCLGKMKTFIDYGVAGFIQKAAATALTSGGEAKMAAVYERRRNAFVKAAATHAGWTMPNTKATMYLWPSIPERFKKQGSFAFAKKLLLDTGVCLSPGVGFGKAGEGFVRIALVEPENRLIEAAKRIGKFLSF
ncbi:aminotransferase class I/II-fold pyridoxal phosphate-dependent enzyme [Elusimicrobiota bacterium]